VKLLTLFTISQWRKKLFTLCSLVKHKAWWGCWDGVMGEAVTRLERWWEVLTASIIQKMHSIFTCLRGCTCAVRLDIYILFFVVEFNTFNVGCWPSVIWTDRERKNKIM
jgi:hypothetical protein